MIASLSRPNTGSALRLRILVVEDDLTSRRAMTRIFEMLGYEVACATTVAEGMAALESRPDSLILDLMLPDGNGMQILRQIRSERLPIRVAILTGADRPMIEQAHQLQPDVLFSKPIDLTRLLAWLNAA